MGSLRNLDFEIPNFENFEQSFSLESSSDGQNRSGHFQIIEMVIGINQDLKITDKNVVDM